MDTGVYLMVFSITLTGFSPLVLTEVQPLDSNSNNISRLLITSNLTFPFTVMQHKVSMLNFNYSFSEDNNYNNLNNDTLGYLIFASLDNVKIARIVSNKVFYIKATSPSGYITVSIEGKLPGRTILYFHAKDLVNKSQHTDGVGASLADVETYGQSSWHLYVQREEMPLDIAFNIIVVLLVVLANIGMGAKVDLAVVKSELKRPIAPIIGLFSQFIFMPLIAFSVAYTLHLDPGIALGLFALGCAPGGSASNAYTYLLDGNVSLSVTMTLVSTLASLGLLPMWLFTLGRVVYRETKIKIPFENIFFSLLGIIIPVIVGLILQRKCPKVASWFIKAVKYIMILFILFILTVGVYANLFIFSLLSGEVLLAAAVLPYLGFILGGLAAFVGRQDVANIITIAVETGIQNTGIPIVLLRLSLQGPDKDTSIVAPVASAIFTPIPLIFGILFVQIRKRVVAHRARRDNPVGEFLYSDIETVDKVRESGDCLIVPDDDDFRS